MNLNLEETATVWAMVALVENRKFTDEQIAAWQSLLRDIDVTHAKQAVVKYYRTSTDIIKPAHIYKLSSEIKNELKKKHYGNFDS